MIEVERVAARPSLVREGWGRSVGTTTATDVGMNSTTVRVDEDGGRLALLRHVSGRSLTSAVDEQTIVAETLARVHSCRSAVRAPGEFLNDLIELDRCD